MNVQVFIVNNRPDRINAAIQVLKKLKLEFAVKDELNTAWLHSETFSRPAIFIISFPNSNRGLNLSAVRALKEKSNCVSIIASLSDGKANELLSYLTDGTIDQIIFEDRPASFYSALKSELIRINLQNSLSQFEQKNRLLKKHFMQERKKSARLEETFDTTIENFMAALDLRDVETYGHSKTVARYSIVLAEKYGIKEQQRIENIRKGALLHDAGKLAIPDSILNKAGTLNENEWEIIRKHPLLGFNLVKNANLVKEIENILLYHHERFDGSGYPCGLKGSEIPVEARIFAVADALDAITSPRPYREARDFVIAKKEISTCAGSQFDPEVVDAFLKLEPRSWEKIRYETTRLSFPFNNLKLENLRKSGKKK